MLRLVADNGPARRHDGQRRAMLAKVHLAKKQLGLADDDYRAAIEVVTGKRSAGDLSHAELEALLAEFERRGFKPARSAPRSARATSPVAQKARALWISLGQLGVVRDTSEKALEAFGKRQLGVERLQWADQSHSDALIEALKAMAERNGWSQKLPARMPAAEGVRVLKDRLVAAQLAKLERAGFPLDDWTAGDRTHWSTEKLVKAADRLAELVRLLPAERGR
ncbi:MAG: regulatory protein GemA [Sphingomonas sp.]|nr:regulatory protein GemA [Sphingomonas sp.]